MDPITVTLAGRPYAIAPLTLGKIIDLRIAVSLPPVDDPQEEVRRSYKRSFDILTIALKPAHPDVTEEWMRGQTITAAEINDAVTTVLKISGLVKPADEGSPQGEGEAGTVQTGS